MPIELVKQVSAPALSLPLVRKVWQATSRCITLPKKFEVSVVIVGDALMKRWNMTYRQTPEVTDVLSFSYGPANGEIALCYAQAKRQAAAKQVPLKNELAWLLTHGLLHLRGYDHETARDALIMRPLEQKILRYV